jgi:hypothetical protein
LSTHSRRLLEARRATGDYNAAKTSYDQARKEFEAVLDTWSLEEEKQLQENRQILERSSTMISQKVPELINQAIQKTLKNWRPADTQLGDKVATGDDPLATLNEEQKVSYPNTVVMIVTEHMVHSM